ALMSPGTPSGRDASAAAETEGMWTPSSRPELVFPVLSAEQRRRLAAHGRVLRAKAGERLAAAGQPDAPSFLVLAGALKVAVRTPTGRALVTIYRPGQFS